MAATLADKLASKTAANFSMKFPKANQQTNN
jgi:hypothetical protein